MPATKGPTPYCHVCGSRDLTATSSTQFRTVQGKRREVADVVCNACGHAWWSASKAVRAMARKADKARKDAA